jgi:hypothetical protein
MTGTGTIFWVVPGPRLTADDAHLWPEHSIYKGPRRADGGFWPGNPSLAWGAGGIVCAPKP